MIRSTLPRKSLSPGGTPTPLPEVCAALRPRADWLSGLDDGLSRIDAAGTRHFPGNLFCDYDYLAKSLLDEAAGRAAYLAEQLERLETLYALYGCASPLRFRYLHDFLYGFDWAKYVQRNPDYAEVAPFHREFLDFMIRRGTELHERVAAGDADYPRLSGAVHRNPFLFTRDPEAERSLFRELAARDLIPVRAWRLDACPRAARPYQALREQTADRLGLIENHTEQL